MDVDVAQRESSSIKRYASAFSNILIGVWSELIAPRWEMEAFRKANLQEMLEIALSSLLLITALPHFPLAQVKGFPENPRSTAPKSNIRS